MIDTTFKLTQQECLTILEERLKEAPPAKIQIVTGPRQAGKTEMLIKLTKKFKQKSLYTVLPKPLPGSDMQIHPLSVEHKVFSVCWQ